MKQFDMHATYFAAITLFAVLTATAVAGPAGDVNGDGDVNVADLIRIREMVAGNIPWEDSADLDGDGAVTDHDAFVVSQIMQGIPAPEPLAAATIGSDGGTIA